MFVGSPLIYILIGGGVNEFDLVKRALDNGIPVVASLVNVLEVNQ